MSLSALIITRNESENISDCLKSLGFCNEIIVVDYASSDGTPEIAKSAGAIVIQTKDWPGFGPQKQRALDAASGDWVLSVDADERVSPTLQTSILDRINANTTNAGFALKRENYFLGQCMRYGGWGSDYPIRLARRDLCHFSSDIVHERLIVNGDVKRIDAPLIHFSYKTIDDVLEKQHRYARAGAELRKAKGQNSGVATALAKSIWTFFRFYVVLFGFLDGSRGLIAAANKSQETFWKYVAIRY